MVLEELSPLYFHTLINYFFYRLLLNSSVTSRDTKKHLKRISDEIKSVWMATFFWGKTRRSAALRPLIETTCAWMEMEKKKGTGRREKTRISNEADFGATFRLTLTSKHSFFLWFFFIKFHSEFIYLPSLIQKC